MLFLKLSLSGALLIILILLIRSVFLYKIPKKVIVWFWCLALLRLLVPFSFSVPEAVSEAVPIKIPAVVSEWSERLGSMHPPGLFTTQAATVQPCVITVTDMAGKAVEMTGDFRKTWWSFYADNVWDATILPVFWLIWLTGMIGFVLLHIGCHLRWCARYREALPVEHPLLQEWIRERGRSIPGGVRIRQSDRIVSPMVCGLFRPVILLPRWTDMDDQLLFVLTHEWVHIRHHDLWKKAAMLLAVCIHWFNPLVWIMFYLFNRDMELSCDEQVIRVIGKESRSDYAHALVGMEEKKSSYSPLFAYFAENLMEQRIKAIMKYQKHPFRTKFCSAAVILLTAVLFGFEVRAVSTETDTSRSEIYIAARTEEGSELQWKAANADPAAGVFIKCQDIFITECTSAGAEQLYWIKMDQQSDPGSTLQGSVVIQSWSYGTTEPVQSIYDMRRATILLEE